MLFCNARSRAQGLDTVYSWNVRKQARLLGLSLADGVRAWLAAIPRLPRALVMREAARRHYRRTDRELLRDVNSG